MDYKVTENVRRTCIYPIHMNDTVCKREALSHICTKKRYRTMKREKTIGIAQGIILFRSNLCV